MKTSNVRVYYLALKFSDRLNPTIQKFDLTTDKNDVLHS